jgi:hypothetical protein
LAHGDGEIGPDSVNFFDACLQTNTFYLIP